MTEQTFVEVLVELLEDDEAVQAALALQRVRTFADAGLLTRNHGIVVTLENGSEFQITVVRRA